MPLVDEILTSRLGSLHALKRGTGKPAARRPAIMITTHMDAIGLMVSGIDDEFLRVHQIGDVDARILPGTPVLVHARRPLPGVVVMPPVMTLPAKDREGPIALQHLLVDVGLPSASVRNLVRIGDLITFDTPPIELCGDVLSGHSLDNRAAIAAMTICLELLGERAHFWDVWAVATVQEEVSFGGATTSAFALDPDLAITIDTTYARGPGAEGWQTSVLGKGPALGWGANLHPLLHRKFEELAKKLEIATGIDLAPEDSGTDAYATQVARHGIPSMLLSIPLRYMHTPVEVISLRDVQRTGKLLAEFIIELQPDFISTLTWDDKHGAP